MVDLAFGLGGTELLIIILAAGMLFFGGKKIPELAKGLGKAMGEFQRGRLDFEREMKKNLSTEEDPPAAVLEPGVPKRVRKLKSESRDQDGPEKQESRIVRAARALGIETEGKSEDELKREIAKITVELEP